MPKPIPTWKRRFVAFAILIANIAVWILVATGYGDRFLPHKAVILIGVGAMMLFLIVAPIVILAGIEKKTDA